MKKILRAQMDSREIAVEMSAQGDAATWRVGASRWRMQRVAGRWELYRVGVKVEICEGSFRAFDDAVMFSVGWCHGLASAQFATEAAIDSVIGPDFLTNAAGEGGGA